MHPSEILLNGITPSLNGLMSDLLLACGGILFLILIVASFWLICEALFVHERADGVSREESEANYHWAISKSEYSSPYEKEVARKKFNRMTSSAARGD